MGGVFLKSKILVPIIVVVALVASLAIVGVSRNLQFEEALQSAESAIQDDNLEQARLYLVEANNLAFDPEEPKLLELESMHASLSKSLGDFERGQTLMTQGEYFEAMESFRKVPVFDEVRRSQAVELALESKEKLIDSSLLQAETIAADEGSYSAAVFLEELPNEARGDTEVRDASLAYRADAILGASENEDHVTVLELVGETRLKGYDIESLAGTLESSRTAYVREIQKEARTLLRAGDVSDLLKARELIGEARSLVGPDDELASLRDTVQDAYDREIRLAQERQDRETRQTLQAMYVKEDDFENIKFIYDKATYSQYAGDKFLLYMAQRGDAKPSLRLRFMMKADSWHFFERIKVNVDGTNYSFEPGYFDVKRDNYLDIWEWWDTSPTSYQLGMVRQIIDSDSARIRYINGDNFYVERTITSSQKRALERVLDAYAALNSGWTISVG